jgi:hypothetical protein
MHRCWEWLASVAVLQCVGMKCGLSLDVPQCQGANVSGGKKCGSSYSVLQLPVNVGKRCRYCLGCANVPTSIRERSVGVAIIQAEVKDVGNEPLANELYLLL